MEMRSNSISWSTLANWACSGCAVIQVGGLELARIKAVGGGVEVAGLAAALAGGWGRGIGHGGISWGANFCSVYIIVQMFYFVKGIIRAIASYAGQPENVILNAPICAIYFCDQFNKGHEGSK